MSDNINVWSDVSLNVQSARAAAKTITAITKASPGNVSSTAHGYLAGDLVLLLVKGMRELNYRIARVTTVLTDSFSLEGIDTTNFHTFTSGTAEKLTFGNAAGTFTTVSPSGGEAKDIDVSTIHSSQDVVVPGNFSALNYSLESLWDVTDPALLALQGFSATKTPCGIEIVFSTGNKVYLAAIPGCRLTPAGSSGAAVTTPVKLSVRGDLTYYAS
jgi:hypothetical protein